MGKGARHLADIADTHQMNFSSSVLTWQAAMDGLGVAIGQVALLMGDIEEGSCCIRSSSR